MKFRHKKTMARHIPWLVAIALAGCQKTATDELAAAKQSLDKRERAAATIHLRAALQDNPQLAEARLLMGENLLSLGNPAGAKIELLKAREFGAPEARVLPKLIRAELATDEPRRVLAQYQADLKLPDPAAKADALAALAEGHYALGNIEEADRLTREALALDAHSVPARLLQVRRLNDGGQADEALRQLEPLLKQAPDDINALLLKGDIAAQRPAGRAEAIKAYEQASALEPQDQRPLAALVTLRMMKKEFDAAGKDVDRLRAISRDGYLTHYMTTWLRLEKGDLKGAGESAAALLRVAPDAPKAAHLAGVVALRSAQYTQAERLLAQALPGHREQGDLRLQLAEAQVRMGSSRKALATLKPLLDLASPPVAALSLAAEASVAAGDAANAQTYYSSALKIDPNNLKGKLYLALEKINAGKQEQGLQDLRATAAADPSLAADLTLVAALMQLRRFADVEPALAEIERKKPNTPVASHLRGQLALVQGQVPQARAAWEDALKRDPSYIMAVRGLAGLDLRENNVAQAEQRFTSFLAKQPGNANALMDLYAVKVQAGTDLAKLRAFLQSAITAAPTAIEPRIALIRTYANARQPKVAIEQAQAALKAFPDNRALLELLAQLHIDNLDTTSARSTIARLRELPGDDSDRQVAIARLQLANGDPAAAAQTLGMAISAGGDTPEAQKLLVAALHKSNKPQQIEPLIRRVAAKDPFQAAVLEGDWNTLRGRHDLAAKAYGSAVARQPSSELALLTLGAMGRAGQTKELERFETQWMADHPRDVVVMTAAAERRHFSGAPGDKAVAERLYRRVLEVQPENPFALNNLASLLLQADPRQALAHAERANKASPNRPWFLDTWAAALAATGDRKAALARQREAVALAPDIPAHRLHLAQMLIDDGDKAGARQELAALEQRGTGVDPAALAALKAKAQ
ncbi:MAG: PEP-CTERM system TPR-repeat protein PrsT [Roseateles sp.]|uniref:XrtA/PEP-CTERM system TPR-repeat protein PrsT n=1 Tax=Roseateles sp. TaxID=1971397 RepID=UPI0039E9BF13